MTILCRNFAKGAAETIKNRRNRPRVVENRNYDRKSHNCNAEHGLKGEGGTAPTTDLFCESLPPREKRTGLLRPDPFSTCSRRLYGKVVLM